MRAGPLGLRLFLEGIEVPVVSAQTTANPGQPAMASIQVVPTDAILELKPRTLAHLFFLDPDISDETADASLAKKRAQAQNAAMASKTAYARRLAENKEAAAGYESMNSALADDNYYLMFVGELVGLSFSKTPVSRSAVLQCLDLSSYWDVCYQWFADWSVNGTALTDKSHIFVGANSGLFDNIASGTRWVVSNILLTPPRSPFYHDSKGLLGGIISLIETVGGLRQAVNSEHGLRGLSDFFTIADRRYNFLGMVGAIEADKTSANIYRDYAFRNWLENGMSSLGNLVSMRDLIRHVCQYTFNDVYPNPAAYYAPSHETTVPTTTAVVGKSSDIGKNVLFAREYLQTAKDQLLEISNDPDNETGPCYVKQQTPAYLTVEETVQGYKGPSSSSVLSGRIASVEDNLTGALENLQAALDLSLAKGRSSASAGLLKAKTGITKAVAKIKTMGKVGSSINSDLAFLTVPSIVRLIDEAFSAISSLLRITEGKKTFFSGGHLMNQLVLPETFFLPPPRCNVIFPDQYTEFQFSRNFLREVTRLSCQGGLGILGKGDTRLLGRYYFAPTIKDANGNSLVSTMRHGARVLLPHEVHSGIIPKFEWVTDGHRWAVDAAQAGGVTSVPYIQRLANFQLFFHRWASRSISVTTKFDPYLVLGLPALIMDRSAPSDAVLAEMKNAIGRAILPTQYLGKITSLTQFIDQSGGRSQIGMSNCRTHRGLDDEFLGVLQEGSVSLYEPETNSPTVSFSPLGLIRDYRLAPLEKSLEDDPNYSVYVSLTDSLSSHLRCGRLGIQTKRMAGALSSEKMTAAEMGTAIYDGKMAPYISTEEQPKSDDYIEVLGTNMAEPRGRVAGAEVVTKYTEVATGYQNVQKKEDEFYRSRTTRGQLLPGEEPVIWGGGALVGQTVPGAGKVLSVKCEGVDIVSDAVRKSIGFANYDMSLQVPEYWFGQSYNANKVIGGGGPYWFIPKKITIEYSTTVMVDYKGLKKGETIAIENALLPGWYDRAIWGSKNVGGKVYTPLLGCMSVTDDANILELAWNIESKRDPGVPAAFQQFDAMSKERTLELAIDSLAILYRDLKENQLNVHDFISQYCRRPIATLPQIMGYQDADGKVVPGFHTQAFGDYNVGAVVGAGGAGTAGDNPMVGLFDKKGDGAFAFPTEYRGGGKLADADSSGIPAYFDPRGNSRARVRMYMAELKLSRGLKGS